MVLRSQPYIGLKLPKKDMTLTLQFLGFCDISHQFTCLAKLTRKITTFVSGVFGRPFHVNRFCSVPFVIVFLFSDNACHL